MGEGHPAAWLTDPTGRHEHRYWDGSQWTDQVSDKGVTATDAPTLAAPAGTPPSTPPAAVPVMTAPSPDAPAAAPPASPTPWWKRWWAIAAAVLVVVVIIAAIAGGGSGGGSKNTSSTNATSVPLTTPLTAQFTAPPTTAAPRIPKFSGDGVYTVGSGQVAPGLYASADNVDRYWQRASDASGNVGSILSNDNAVGQALVQLNAGEIFTTKRCSDWIAFLGGTSKASFGDGTWSIPSQVGPGRWQSSGGAGCYWERDKDLAGGVGSINANDNVDGPTVVDVGPGDIAFKTRRCGTWTKVG